jgi:hypothetical protein
MKYVKLVEASIKENSQEENNRPHIIGILEQFATKNIKEFSRLNQGGYYVVDKANNLHEAMAIASNLMNEHNNGVVVVREDPEI